LSRKLLYTISGVRRLLRVDDDGNELVIFTGTFSSQAANQLTFVPVISDLEGEGSPLNEVKGGYQRPGKGSRMKQFAKYLGENALAIVPPVLLSTRDRWEFESKSKEFGIIKVYGPAAIVDGQHRLGGYILRAEKLDDFREIDFVAYAGLAYAVEAQAFVTINGKAQKVPKGVERLISNRWSTKISMLLTESGTSPLYERIYIVGSKDLEFGFFNLSSFDKQVERTFSHGSFLGLHDDEDIGTLYAIIERYWQLIAKHFSDEWEDIDRKKQEFKLLELTGVIAWSYAASEILGRNFDSSKNKMNWAKVESLIEGIASCGYVDWSKDGAFAGRTGEYGGRRIYKELQKAIIVIQED